MDEQTLVIVLLGIVNAGLGWHVRTLHARTHAQAEKIAGLQVMVAGQYVTRTDYQRTNDAIFAMLRRIEDKIDRKADKPGGNV